MLFQNTSHHDTSEVRELVDWTLEHLAIDRDKLALSVEDGMRGKLGMAYSFPPSDFTIDGQKIPSGYHLVRIYLARRDFKDNYPTNLISKMRKRAVTKWLDDDPRYGERREIKTIGGNTLIAGNGHYDSRYMKLEKKYGYSETAMRQQYLYRVFQRDYLREPYGGKGSPYQEYTNWQELLVSTLAHEAQHVMGQEGNTYTTEIQCERASDTILRRYRRYCNEPEYTPGELAYAKAHYKNGALKPTRKLRKLVGSWKRYAPDVVLPESYVDQNVEVAA